MFLNRLLPTFALLAAALPVTQVLAQDGSQSIVPDPEYNGLPAFEVDKSSYEVTKQCIIDSMGATLGGAVHHLIDDGREISGMRANGAITVIYNDVNMSDLVEIYQIDVLGEDEGSKAKLTYLDMDMAMTETSIDLNARKMVQALDDRMRACKGPILLG